MLGREVNQPSCGTDISYISTPGINFTQKTITWLGLYCSRNSHEYLKNYARVTMVSIKFLEHFYKVGDVVYFLDTAKVKFKSRKLNS